MSDLKYKTVEELQEEKQLCEKHISQLKSNLSGKNTKLEWIDHYIFEKTPQELSISEIEQRLGHRVIIV